ncbi:beta-ketoacyl synthase N-terminal-like domain-containing protein [Escherichia coli]
MKTNRKRVVITGLGILSSLAENIQDFREALLNKKNGVKDSERFAKWFENARAAEVLHDIEYSDLNEDVIDSLDNAALWAYKVGKDALSQAGLMDSRDTLKETGMIVGVSSAGTEAFLPLFEQRMEDFSLRKALFSGAFSSCCSSVSTLLGLQGGVELVATACTASPNAVGMAFDYIQNGKSKTMLAVGTEPIYLPTFAGFYALNVMHPDTCTPFSGQSGMSIGEGAGAIVLEEYEHAVARGATIYGEILSYATSCDAFHETGPDPRASGAVQVMNKAMANAGVTPEQIDYVNAHGTGTEANDRIETLAMKKVFANHDKLLVSSTKSYFGHNIGAAGIVELIACLATLPETESNFKTFQVSGLEPRKHLRRFDQRKATRGGTFALIALTEALEQAKRKIKRDGDELGMIMGMSRGPQETTYKYLQSLKPDPRKVRTSEFPGSLMNAIPTFCGISEGIKGYTTTLATGENSALGALTYGYEIVRQNLQPQVLVGGADEYFPSMSLYMDAVTQKIHMTAEASDYQIYGKDPQGYVPGEGACMLLLEDPQLAVARGAEVLAEVVGYGKSCSNTYFDASLLEEKSASMALAIERALTHAGISAGDIDLVCGTSNGSDDHSRIEIDAIYNTFAAQNPAVPVVNYNACFGFVASAAGLLNLAVITDCIKKQAVPAIPNTVEFFDERVNFVRQSMKLALNHVLLVGATEGGNYYAFVIKG